MNSQDILDLIPTLKYLILLCSGIGGFLSIALYLVGRFFISIIIGLYFSRPRKYL